VGRAFLAGWVARTRPLAGPLSPRGPQPVVTHARRGHSIAQWAASLNWRGTHGLVLWWYHPSVLAESYIYNMKGLILTFRPEEFVRFLD